MIFLMRFLYPKHYTLNPNNGFTLVELLLVIALFGIISAFATINLLRPQTKASLDGTVTTLVADLKQQQIKAMAGDSEGSGTSSEYGLYAQPTSYTLFKGISPGSPTDFVINVSAVTLSTTFPSSRVVFSKRSGEISGFISGSNTITVTNNVGESKVITVNQYGVVSY